ncbi:hypothetical protein CPB85DRAFT_134568 [Mucidula mucida]|nr:hypothetical protein CPB85DRAFT_134568 [Mucidula mucida]
MVWRTWAIYARRWLAIVFPVLTMLTSLVAVGIGLAVVLIPASVDESQGDRLVFIDWDSIYFSMVVGTNTLCTVLIIGRIIFVTGWRHALQTYGGIINILVESAFIYSGAFIIYIALFDSADDRITAAAYSYLHAMLPSITCFAPTLVVLRVASGHAVTTSTSVMPSTGDSARIHFADCSSDVDLENSAGT